MKEITVDVLVIGGGTSGSAAGIQAARMGAKTLIVEDTPWLGGMITSAGVSAFDGNKYALGGGIFGEFRKMLEDYYGGPDKTYTGWISLTCFEPKIGKKFLHHLAEKEKFLSVWFESSMINILKKNNTVIGAVIKRKTGEEIIVYAKVTIEATEYGDVLAKAGIPYRLGRDTKKDTGEPHAPEIHDYEIQDMTFCAILKKYDGNALPVPKPENYNPEQFKCSVKTDCDINDEKYLNHKLHDWESFISYASLPNDKYLLNWPFRANDYYNPSPDIFEDPSTRKEHYRKAKELTLAYIHYMQTTLGHPEWGLAEDEFPTEDKLPFIPYFRESRRMKGVYLMVEDDVVPHNSSYRPPLQKSSIAVGDYFLDHHHSSFFKNPKERLVEELPDNAPFQVPYECLLPEFTDGLIAAEKSISVSHIVNGCTRLQPVVMLIGQAAGAAAALASAKNIQPRNVNVEELQSVLLNFGCQLFPYKDVPNDHSSFGILQRLALKGIFIDEVDFEFGLEKIVTKNEVESLISKLSLLESEAVQLINICTGYTREELFKKINNIITSSK